MRGIARCNHGVAAALVAVALTWLVPVGAAHAQTTVSMGRPGDHWASMLPFTFIGRGERDGVYGYDVKLRAADGCAVELFYPRAAIDFHGQGRGWTLRKVRVATGWLYYPSRLTARSLPRVHPGVLEIEGHYQRQADGAIAAAKGFAIVATLGTMAPVPRSVPTPRTPRVRTPRVRSSRRAPGAAPATSAVKQLPPGINPRSVTRGLSNRNLKHLRKHLPEFQKLDPGMTAEKLRELGASLVRPGNLISKPDAGRMMFEGVIDIGGNATRVRSVLNEAGKLRSVHIRR